MSDDDIDSSQVVIDNKALIRAVKQKPILYDKDDTGYYTQKLNKAQIWREVGKEVVKDWDKLKPQQRVLIAHLVQRRWKNLRTCFVRELQRQKEDNEKREQNIPVKSRKVYSYYKYLSFLLPAGDETYTSNYTNEDNEVSNSSFSSDNNYEIETPVKRKRKPIKTETVNVTSDIDFKQYAFDQSQSETDEDKHFLLSLLPAFRNLSNKQKFDARIEILKVMREISYSGDN